MRGKKRGFSLVELLVVIAIIGVLIALLLPAVQAAREAARRASCQNNLKQIGLALHNFESAKKQLPKGAKQSASGSGNCWWVDILPQLEEGNIYGRLTFDVPDPGIPIAGSNNGQVANNVTMAVMRCPSSQIPVFSQPNSSFPYQICLPSYVGIAGSTNEGGFSESRVTVCCAATLDGQISAGGVLVPNQSIKISQITDGTSNVLCVGEGSDFVIDNFGRQREIDGGYPLGWLNGTNGTGSPPNYVGKVIKGKAQLPPPAWNVTTIRYSLNDRTYQQPGIADTAHGPNNPLTSPHAGGVFGLFVDGSVHFLNESLELLTLRRLATRDDGAIASF